ncbi:MAG TPA: GYD domain-containing protein [Steroidobacteraceae bacterium]|nr:GYD domain-containing protein [Steroidobacteraceae bacterium]
MAKYLIEGTYSAEGLRGLQKDKASGRKQAVSKLIESLEGRLEAIYFALGDRDVVLIVDVPDIITGAALSLAASATGLVRTKATALLTVEETDRALEKKVVYRAPGT